MKIKSLRDFLSGLMFIAFGVLFAIGATNDVLGGTARPGAGWYPLVLSVLLGLLGAIVLFKSLAIETEGGDPIGPVAWRGLFAIVAAIALFGAAIKPLGLLLAVPLAVLVASLASRDARWPAVLVSAAVLTLVTWGVFVLGLGLALPIGPSLGSSLGSSIGSSP